MKRDLLIGPHSYRLNRSDLLFSSGLCKPDTREIVVNLHRGAAYADETLFHEMFHACESALVEAGTIEEASAESYVESMAALLYQTLKRNGMLCMNVEWEQMDFDWMLRRMQRGGGTP